MSEPSIQQLVGQPSEVPVGDKVYYFGPPTQKAKAVLEDLFVKSAVEDLERLRAVLSPQLFKVQSDRLMARIDAKGYATGGDGWLAMIQSAAGQQLFLLSLFRVHHPTMTMAEMNDIAAKEPLHLQAALVRQVPDFFVLAFPMMTPEMREGMAETFRQAVASRPLSPSGDSPPNGTAP